MIAIIDYGVGNLFSLRSSLTHLGLEAVVTADAQTIRKADRYVLDYPQQTAAVICAVCFFTRRRSTAAKKSAMRPLRRMVCRADRIWRSAGIAA